jgi:hypothetical protein
MRMNDFRLQLVGGEAADFVLVWESLVCVALAR